MDLLRAAGAGLDLLAKRWYMVLTEDQLSANVLDKLFYVAREYGARITAREELAAAAPVEDANTLANEDRRAALRLAEQAHQVGYARAWERWETLLRRLGRRRGWLNTPQLRSPMAGHDQPAMRVA